MACHEAGYFTLYAHCKFSSRTSNLWTSDDRTKQLTGRFQLVVIGHFPFVNDGGHLHFLHVCRNWGLFFLSHLGFDTFSSAAHQLSDSGCQLVNTNLDYWILHTRASKLIRFFFVLACAKSYIWLNFRNFYNGAESVMFADKDCKKYMRSLMESSLKSLICGIVT